MDLKQYFITMINELNNDVMPCDLIAFKNEDSYLVVPYNNLRTASANSFNEPIQYAVIECAESLVSLIKERDFKEFKVSLVNYNKIALTLLDMVQCKQYIITFNEDNQALLDLGFDVHREDIGSIRREESMVAHAIIDLANYLTTQPREGLFTKLEWTSIHMQTPRKDEPAEWALVLAMDLTNLASKGYSDLAVKFQDGKYLILDNETILASVEVTEGVGAYIKEVSVASIYGGYESIVANALDQDHALELVNGNPLAQVPSKAVTLLTSKMMRGAYKTVAPDEVLA